MSLLLEALKKAEKAKEEAQRRASGEPQPAEAAAPGTVAAETKAVVTRDRLPDIPTPLEIVSDDLTRVRTQETPTLEPLEPVAKPAPPPAAPPPRRGAPSTDEAGRATAKKVFEAKFREPNPRMPFYISVVVLGLFAAGTVIYFWYQLRPPYPLVNLNPPPAGDVLAAPAQGASPAAATSAAAAPARERSIPGLPGSPADVSAAKAPARSATPAIPASPGPAAPAARAPAAMADPAAPREEPRLAPRAPALPATSARSTPAASTLTVNPQVESGYTAYVAGDLAKARAEYEEALRAEPGNRDALLGLGALDVRAGHYESAEALYLRVLQADPRDPEAQAALLSLRAGRSDPLATESRVKSLLATEPDAHALNFTLGNQLAQQNRWEEAQREYLKAYAAEPGNADFAYNVAVSFDHLHQGARAREYYERALALARTGGASFDVAAAQARVAQLGR
jgi:tetratricopeptide (TPR) repeat protein